MSPLPEFDVERLSISERLDLITLLWDSIPVSLEAMPIPEWHIQELKKRLAAADADPTSGISWETTKSRRRENQ